MRPHFDARARRAGLALGALAVAYSATASAPLEARARTLTITSVNPARELRYGQPMLLSGRLPGAAAGTPVQALLRGAVGAPKILASAMTSPTGAYRMNVSPSVSGMLLVSADQSRVRSAPVLPPGVVPAAQAAAAEQPVVISAALRIGVRRLDVLAGHRAEVDGTVLPGRGGRQVLLQVRHRHGWRTIARARTGPAGRFRLGFTPHRTASTAVRISFAGDPANGPAATLLGRLNAYRSAQASWYGAGLYGSALACGGRLGPDTVGVANRTLPCGTQLTLHYRGRTVRAPVVDRGPYVGGRDFDLTAATKRRLGFGDTGAVWVTG